MKRFFFLLWMVTCFIFPIIGCAEQQYVKITENWARVRDPDTEEVVANLKIGDTVPLVKIVMEDGKERAYILYNGKECYVYAGYVQVISGQTTPSVKKRVVEKVEKAYFSFGQVVVKVGNTLNIRKEASSQSKQLGRYQQYDFIEIYGEKDGFYKVFFQDDFAYVKKDYVNLIKERELKNGEAFQLLGEYFVNDTGFLLSFEVDENSQICIKRK